MPSSDAGFWGAFTGALPRSINRRGEIAIPCLALEIEAVLPGQHTVRLVHGLLLSGPVYSRANGRRGHVQGQTLDMAGKAGSGG